MSEGINREDLESKGEKMVKETAKKVTHPNGYSAVLYDEKSMDIYNPEGMEVLHTSSRNVNTEEEVLNHLETIPGFLKKITIPTA